MPFFPDISQETLRGQNVALTELIEAASAISGNFHEEVKPDDIAAFLATNYPYIGKSNGNSHLLPRSAIWISTFLMQSFKKFNRCSDQLRRISE